MENTKKWARDEMILKGGLKARGWTEKLIRQFYPSPDREVRNPRRTSTTIKYYALDRVTEIEASEEFQAARAVAKQRSERAKATAETRRKETIRWAEDLPPPSLPAYDRDTLISLACQHYNQLWMFRGRDDKWASASASDEFLDRISVNYLRHECSHYEDQLMQAWGSIAASQARTIIKEKVLLAIEEAYPWLEDECNRQIDRIYELWINE
jgi:hypothetical protein